MQGHVRNGLSNKTYYYLKYIYGIRYDKIFFIYPSIVKRSPNETLNIIKKN